MGGMVQNTHWHTREQQLFSFLKASKLWKEWNVSLTGHSLLIVIFQSLRWVHFLNISFVKCLNRLSKDFVTKLLPCLNVTSLLQLWYKYFTHWRKQSDNILWRYVTLNALIMNPTASVFTACGFTENTFNHSNNKTYCFHWEILKRYSTWYNTLYTEAKVKEL